MPLDPSVTPQQASSQGDRQPVVLQVLPALVTGGVERGTVEIANALVAAGWGSIVVSSGGPLVREVTRGGGLHIELPVNSKNPIVMRRNVARLEKIIRQHGVDIVHARSRAPAWSALAAANRVGCHFVTTFHGTYNLGMGGLKQKYNAVMTRGERVIAISDFIARHIESTYGLDPDRIRIIPRGVDLTKFDPARVSQERMIQLATAWRLPDGFPIIMLPGRLTRWKGQSVLIEAIAKLGRKDIRCLLVGSDQGRTGYKEELVALVKRHGLSDVIHIVGDCADMPAAYMLADVVVSASTDAEAFGRIAVEAQAMGRPVVATDHGGARETVINAKTGWLTPPGDPAALAEAIDAVLRMRPQDRAQMAEFATQHVREIFTKERMCERTMAVYNEVLNPAPVQDQNPAPDQDTAKADG